MTSTLLGADIRGYYRALGVELLDWAIREASVRRFVDPDAHAHDDRRPSCSVNLESGVYHCWGCGAKGGAYDAAIGILKFSPREAVDLMIEFGLTERRVADAGARRPRRPAPPARQRNPSAAKRGAERELETSDAQVRSWQEQLVQLAWAPRTLRPEHRHLWKLATLRELGIGWDGRRLTIPVRDVDGRLRGVLRYAPIATRSPKMIAATGTRLGLIPIRPPSRRDGSCSPRVPRT
jgi:hypothetical protein